MSDNVQKIIFNIAFLCLLVICGALFTNTIDSQVRADDQIKRLNQTIGNVEAGNRELQKLNQGITGANFNLTKSNRERQERIVRLEDSERERSKIIGDAKAIIDRLGKDLDGSGDTIQNIIRAIEGITELVNRLPD